MRRLIILGAAVVLLAGCGSAEPDASGGSSAPSSAISAPSSTTPAPPTAYGGSSAPSSLDPAPGTTVAVAPDGGETGAVVAAVVERVTRDNSMGGTVTYSTVRIVDRFGSVGQYSDVSYPADAPPIDPDTKAAISAALAPLVVEWVTERPSVIGTDGNPMDWVDPFVTIAVPTLDGTTARVTTGITCGGLCGTGSTYVLEWSESTGWQVTGTDGPVWIS